MAKRVLLAEDEANIAESISFLLERAGFEVTVEDDGRKALDSVMADAPDVLVLDVMLPGLDGYEILRTSACGPTRRVAAGADAHGQGISARTARWR